jgi:FKBP-type peptidyl-prolyl cis-trans isomerase 2
MQKEKIVAIILVVIVVAALFAYIGTKEDLFGNLFGPESEEVELGDCVDIHYIGRYTSNGTVFSSSYDDVENKTGGTPIQVYVNLNKTAEPAVNYSTYYSSLLKVQSIDEYFNLYLSPLAVKEGFIEKLTNFNLKNNNITTTGNLPPEKAFGISLKLDDIINMTSVYLIPTEYKIIDIVENATMPSEITEIYGEYFAGKTTLYTLRQNLHYVEEIIQSKYPSWENSTVVTKINETMLWMYTTPAYDVNVNFTWNNFDSLTGIQMSYPINSSSVTSINESSIVITHAPKINSTIEESIYYAQYNMFYPTGSYTVESLTDNKINVSYVVDETTGKKSFKEFNRTTIIQRNETQNITEDIPGEILEIQLMMLRHLEDDFIFSCNPLADKEIYFELEIVQVYKTSQQES